MGLTTRTRRRTHNLLGGAAVQDTIEPAAAVPADHDQVAALLGCGVNDGIHRSFVAQQVLNLDLWIDRDRLRNVALHKKGVWNLGLARTPRF
jgi:hypothetical protein